MKLAISNIAWKPDERFKVYDLLRKKGIKNLEIAPGLLFFSSEDPLMPSNKLVKEIKLELKNAELNIVSMQSLFYGSKLSVLFGTPSERVHFENNFKKAINLAEKLEIPNLVFGSPKNRCFPKNLNKIDAFFSVKDLFLRLGDYAKSSGTIIGIETNPTAYGTNFLTNLNDTIKFIEQINHKNVKITLDTGELFFSDYSSQLNELLYNSLTHINHVHLSEPFLKIPSNLKSTTVELLSILSKSSYNNYFSIELQRPKKEILSTLNSCIEIFLNSGHFFKEKQICHHTN